MERDGVNEESDVVSDRGSLFRTLGILISFVINLMKLAY